MSVRAKFKVSRVEISQLSLRNDENTGYENKEVRTIVFVPVVDGNEENKKFFAATPYGEIKLGTVSLAASSQFEIGKEYFVDFSPAE